MQRQATPGAVQIEPRFPGGLRNALVMSYDDGSEHDRRLVELFNRYGIRGSFHLNASKLDRPYHVGRDEVASLYQGHEVSGHTVNHPNLTELSDEAIRSEILDDRHVLQSASGQAVRGLAYPFGRCDERVVRIARALETSYGRTADSTMSFGLPDDALVWRPSCHHNDATGMAEAFARESAETVRLLHVWGHSYELDGFMSKAPEKDWNYMERLCRLLCGHPSIWYATSIDVADYLRALDQLEAVDGQLRNGAGTTVWLGWHGREIELAPGAWA